MKSTVDSTILGIHIGLYQLIRRVHVDRICIYDSMHRGGDLTSSLQIQLAQVYKTKIEREGSHKTLNVECLALQQQHGGPDCGVFAIAFAYHAILINLAIQLT